MLLLKEIYITELLFTSFFEVYEVEKWVRLRFWPAISEPNMVREVQKHVYHFAVMVHLERSVDWPSTMSVWKARASGRISHCHL